MFVFGVFLYQEPLASERLLTFGLIWTALLVYSLDTFWQLRQGRRQ